MPDTPCVEPQDPGYNPSEILLDTLLDRGAGLSKSVQDTRQVTALAIEKVTLVGSLQLSDLGRADIVKSHRR
jgi:hypothetical protein